MVFVDEKCIGCGVCESIAPTIFKVEGLSTVIKQPEGAEEQELCKQSISACPVEAIHD